jgi:hypothetical protein
MSLRVTPEMKRQLDTAAQQNGRSQSQEAEMRLARSFDRDNLLIEVLTLAYGNVAAGVLMMLGRAMADTWLFEPPNEKEGPRLRFTTDPDFFDPALEASGLILDAFRSDDARSSSLPHWVRLSAERIVGLVRGESEHDKRTPGKDPFTATAAEVRTLLGPVADRLNLKEPKP